MGAELAKAYVQIVPSAQGLGNSLTEMLGGEAGAAGDSSGGLFGSNMVQKLKAVLAAAGVGKIISEALNAGGALQQSLGGIETLYGKSADTMKKYAENAYKTTGLSANAYMEQVTSFSAGLIASMSGDTKGAAEVAHMAMVDMADNANKMGTSMESIQNAYQGFAKQNYTMLDNLKLGYGGTKSEMERLLADASALTGVKYDINHLDDVYTAIHVMQEQIGITGTTSAEAAETFTGSMSAMKASAENLLAYMTTGGDVTGALTTLMETASIFLFNNMLPMLGNFASAIPTALGTAISVGAPLVVDALGQAVNGLLHVLSDVVPDMLEAGMGMLDGVAEGLRNGFPKLKGGMSEAVSVMIARLVEDSILFVSTGMDVLGEFVNGLVSNIPAVIDTAGEIMAFLLEEVISYAPDLLSSGVQLVLNIANGLLQNIPSIVSSITKVLAKLITTIGQNMPQFLQSGIEILSQLIVGIIQMIPKIPGTMLSVASSIRSAITGVDWASLGKNIMTGVANGIKNGATAIVNAAKSAAKSALNAAKNFLGIHSPSRVFRDEVGENIALGWAGGILDEASAVEDAVGALSDASVGAISTDIGVASNPNDETYQILAEWLPKIANMQIVLDDGTLVGRLSSLMNQSLNAAQIMELRGLA